MSIFMALALIAFSGDDKARRHSVSKLSIIRYERRRSHPLRSGSPERRMISQKAKYAFKALIHLARQPKGDTIQIDDIARKAGVPRKFLEHILLDLKHRGIIASRRGRSGGYMLIKPADEVTIGQVLRAIDGPIAPLSCISRTAYQACADCADEETCAVRRMFAGTYAAQLLLFDATTLADALREEPDGIDSGPERSIIPA
jgi:Rrf2 family protein